MPSENKCPKCHCPKADPLTCNVSAGLGSRVTNIAGEALCTETDGAECLRRQLSTAQAERDKAQAACAAMREALKEYATCQHDGCTCGDGWSHHTAADALAQPNPGQAFLDRLEKLQRLEKAVGDDEFAMKVAGQASNRPNGYPEIDAIALYRAALLEAAKAAQEQPQ